MLRSSPMRAVSSMAAWSSQSTARRGLQTQSAKALETGRSAGKPSNGSRMIAETKLLAALLGRPGRTITVGKRMLTASSIPRREVSASSSSPIAFCVP